MSGPYTSNYLLEIPVPGDPIQKNQWGTMENEGRILVDTALGGILPLSVAGAANVVLTSAPGAPDQSRSAQYNFTGALTGNVAVLWPQNVGRTFSVTNSTTGSPILSIGADDGTGNPAGTTVEVPQSGTLLLYSDGVNVASRATSFYGTPTAYNPGNTVGFRFTNGVGDWTVATGVQAGGDGNFGISNSGTTRLEIGPTGLVGVGVNPSLLAAGATLGVQNVGNTTGLQVSNGNGAWLMAVGIAAGNDTIFGLSNVAAGGGVRLQMTAAGALRLNQYGAGTLVTDGSGNVSASSDERLKTAPDGISGVQLGSFKATVEDICPIEYRWNDKSGMETETVYAGFSAQNVKQAIGEIAVGEGSDGMMTIQDRAILAAAINTINALTKRIAVLEAKT